MADIYEFTTWPKHQNIFYKVSSGAIVFYVKGSRNAAIGIAEKPGIHCDYWVLLGYNQQCIIQEQGSNCSQVSIRNILSEEKYKKFWISWYNRKLQVGKSNDPKPFLSRRLSANKLQYVTFSVLHERQAIHWKIYLPPQIEKPLLRVLNDGDPNWVRAEDQLPDGALIGGYENGILYIIRAYHRGSLTPGKFVPSMGLGFISWGGEEHEKSELEVLVGYNCSWVKTKGNNIPIGAIEGGYSEDGHETLYIGRVYSDGHLIPGKVQPSHKCCYIPYNRAEMSCETYEILVKPCIGCITSRNFYWSGIKIQNSGSDMANSDDESASDDEEGDN